MKRAIATILSTIIISSPLTAMAFTSQQITESNPAILPGNPFYFVKTWTQGFQEIFITNPIKKVMFSSYLLDQKGAEIAVSVGLESPNISEEAIADYSQKAISFSDKIAGLTPEIINENLGVVFETSDQLVDYLLERTIIHLELHMELFNLLGESQTLTSSELALREAINNLALIDTDPSINERIMLISQAQGTDFALQFLQ